MELTRQCFSQAAQQPIWIYELSNDNGIRVCITNYGCIIMSISTPGADGQSRNIVAGFDSVSDYFTNPFYFGCIVGRCTNRIANATISVEGKTYRLSANAGRDHLHGGVSGFDKKIWQVENEIRTTDEVGIVFSYWSRDEEEGYPGNLQVTVSYSLCRNNRLEIKYRAIADKTTPVNLTNHTYFNLTGFEQDTIWDHDLFINAEKYTPTTESLIPKGVMAPVKDTGLDFRTSSRIGARIARSPDKSYDHNFVLNKQNGEMVLAAVATDPSSGRILKIFTDQPCVQLYTSGHLDGTLKGSQGKQYGPYSAFCLETQQFPDAVNQPAFPKPLVSPGEEFSATTIFEFGIN